MLREAKIEEMIYHQRVAEVIKFKRVYLHIEFLFADLFFICLFYLMVVVLMCGQTMGSEKDKYL